LIPTGNLAAGVVGAAENVLAAATAHEGEDRLGWGRAGENVNECAVHHHGWSPPAEKTDISDPQEVIARAEALSLELATPITPGIEDIYELTYIRKNGSRFPAVVSITALRDAEGGIIG